LIKQITFQIINTIQMLNTCSQTQWIQTKSLRIINSINSTN